MKCPFCSSEKDVRKLPFIEFDNIPSEKIYGCNDCKQYLFEQDGELKPINE